MEKLMSLKDIKSGLQVFLLCGVVLLIFGKLYSNMSVKLPKIEAAVISHEKRLIIVETNFANLNDDVSTIKTDIKSLLKRQRDPRRGARPASGRF